MSCISRLALVAFAALAASPAAAQAPPPGTAPGRPAAPGTPIDRTLVNPNSVVVFPFERAPQPTAPPTLGETIAGQLRAGLDASGTYSATTYYAASPLVQRARGQTGLLTAEDVAMVIDPARGVVDQERAARVAAAMGAATAVLGGIEEYRYDPQANKADITVTVQHIQVPSGTPIKTVGVTASATAPAGTSQEAVAQMAAREVARRALTEMGVSAAPATPATVTPANGAGTTNGAQPPATRARTSGRRVPWLAIGALLGAIAIASD